MSLIDFVNDRAVLLRTTSPRNINPRASKFLFLQAVPPVFHVAANGTISPASVTLTASLFGISGAVDWSSAGATLSGATNNVRAIAAADMAGASATVTVEISYQGEIYTATQVVQKVADGATGSDANVTPDVLLNALAGKVTETQLEAALRARIALVDDPVGVAGSVQSRVKAEADARVAAIQKEVDDRIAAVLAEAGARSTYVQSYTYSKTESDSALSIQATALAAYTDAKKGEAIAAAAADVRNYSYAKTTVDAAEAAQSSALTAGYTSYADAKKSEAVTIAAADVRSYGYSKGDTDGAIASMASTLRSEFSSSGGATTAYVQDYAYSKAQIDSAEALQSSTLTANYQTYADSRRDQAITTASADVRNYAYGKAAVDGAFASQSNAINATYTYADTKKAEAISVAAADVRSYSYAKASVDGAITSATDTINARLNNAGGTGVSVETKMTATANAVNGLNAQYTIKLDVNGYVAGIGVANDGASSPMVLYTSSLKMVAPGSAPGTAGIEAFDVTSIGGVPTMRFNGVIIMKSATSGARVETDKNGMRAYDGVQALPRVEVGLLS